MGKSDDIIRIVFVACRHLCLPITSAITAVSLVHDYLRHKEAHDMIVVVAAVIFLSAKVDENHRSLGDVISVVCVVVEGRDPDENMITLIKKQVVEKEQSLLREIKFRTHIDVPHKYLTNMARSLRLQCSPVSLAWGMLNDCFLDKRSTEVDPSAMALGCIYVALLTVGREDVSVEPMPAQAHMDEYLLRVFGVAEEQFWRAVQLVVNTQAELDNEVDLLEAKEEAPQISCGASSIQSS